MKPSLFSRLLIISSLFLASVTWAAPTVGQVTVDPNHVNVNTPTQVSVTAVITDASFIPGGANLQRLNAGGKWIILGILHDDGINGDKTARDGILTILTNFNEPTTGKIRLRVSAAFKGLLKRIFSDEFEIVVGTADTTPPVVQITSPANGSLLNTQPINVSGSIDDNTATVVVNGISATVSNGTFIATGVPLIQGANVITATATDVAGNVGTSSVNVIVDTIAPVLAITSPTNNFLTKHTPITVTGTVDDNAATVSVNGVSAIVSNGTFTTTGVSLTEGANIINATATDLAGNSGSASISGTLDTMAPVVEIVSPANGFMTNQATVNVIGTIDDTMAIVNVNGIAATVSSNTFSVTGVNLTEGANTITATATDLANNIRSASISVTKDTVYPTIAITYPKDGALIDDTTPLISINYTDEATGINSATFQASINGNDYTSLFALTSTTATYQVVNTLDIGKNIINVTINDFAGNPANAVSNFTIAVLRAIPGATPVTGKAPLTVRFTTNGEDPFGTIEVFRWDFNGDKTWDTYDTVANDYSYTYNNPGTYNATLYVKSSTGKTATASIVITVENNPPVAKAGVVPSNGAVPLTVQLLGSGTDIDGHIALYEWDFDGNGTFDWYSTTTGNTTYTYNTPGSYQAVFRVTDDKSLTGTAKAYTTAIAVGPPGSPTATASATPTEGEAPLTVSLSGTATDPNGEKIVLYEWDFDGDGEYDWSSSTSGSTTYSYTKAGLHIARFRATDATGLTGTAQVGIYVKLKVSLSVTHDTAGTITDMTNLTGMGGVTIAASSTYEECSTYYPVTNVFDGNTENYWMSMPGDTPNLGASTFVETTFTNPRTITQVNIQGGSYYPYYGITRAKLEFFDVSNNLLYSTEETLSQDAQIIVGLVENVKRVRITALAANDGGGAYNQVSIGEIEILDEKGFTATASSEYDPDWGKVENLFDPNQSWYSTWGDHPNHGTNPWIEVDFTSPQKVSRVIVDQTWDYYWIGVTRAKIELIDDSGNTLYRTENDLSDYELLDMPNVENVKGFKLTILAANGSDWGYDYVSIHNLDILSNVNGQFISLIQKPEQGNYSASSEWKTDCYSYYPATNLLDGNSETYWLSGQNSTPQYGVYPFVEITFPSPQTVSQIIIDGGSWYSWDGITKAKIELLDANGAILHSEERNLGAIEKITLPNITNVSKARFTALEGISSDYCSWGDISMYQKLDNISKTTTDIVISISADTYVSISIIDSKGNLIRTLADNEFRLQGSYSDNWDIKDNSGFWVKDGVYYAILKYVDADGQISTYDLTNTSGGTRYSFPFGSGCNTRSGFDGNISPFSDKLLSLTFIICKAQEVTAFIGPLWGGEDVTRVRTIVNRKPFPAGTHTIYWDGLDDNGNDAQAPPGDSLITGFWHYDLPNNAIFVTGESPEITSVSAVPNYFSPFSEKCDENGNGEGVTINYTLSEDVATVKLNVYSVKTGSLLRTRPVSNVPAGENVVFWDGRNNDGEYLDIGDYRIGLIAVDANGNESMFRYTLVRLDY